MNVEENRLQTFSEWPANAAVDAARIAKAGFFYTGHALEVQCFLCGTIVSAWNYGDGAMARHRQAAPSCPFVQNPNDTCNVPLIPTSDNSLSTASSSTDAMPVNDSTENPNPPPFVRSKDPQKEYCTINKRLKSFTNWPKSNIISPETLAITGFYYLQSSDAVECAFCGCTIMNWTQNTDMDKIHREFLPKCEFYVSSLDNHLFDLHNLVLRPGTTEDHTELGIQTHTAPATPKYSTYEERLKTFINWPSTHIQTPQMLARAGFYYAGYKDVVTCFYCDGGLRKWEATDNAWTEHATWFPKCGYLKLVHGSAFIKQSVDNRPPLDPAIFEGVPEEENAEIVETPPASISTLPPCQEITDATIERLMNTPPLLAAIETGIDVCRVRRVLIRRLQHVGVPYESAEQLIEDVFAQDQEEDNSPGTQTPDSPSFELINLLNHVTTEEENKAAPQSSEFEIIDATLDAPENNGIDIAANNEVAEDQGSDNKVEAAESAATAKKIALQAMMLEEENRQLKEARLCKICMDWEISVVFLPCGHLATCVYCAPSLTCCPMCRQKIRAVVRTFVS